MNNITIKVELCEEDRARLDNILQALSGGRNCAACVDGITKYVAAEVGQHIKPAAVPAETHPVNDPFPAPETPAAEPTPDPEPEAPAEAAPTVTHADVQRKVVELSAAGKKDKVREIVTAYAKKVSDLPEDKLAEVWDKLTALGV